VECRLDGITFYEGREAPPRFFSMERLNRELAVVHNLQERGTAQAGGTLTRDQEWLFFKAVIERDQRLRDTLTLALHLVEIGNLKGEGKPKREERYPIILVSADALNTYGVVTELMDITSRMPVGVEPLLPGWLVQPDRGVPAFRGGPAGQPQPPGGRQ
jgi:hypothetical protein